MVRLLLANAAKLKKSPFSQPVDYTAFPSRDSLGVYHAISRRVLEPDRVEAAGICLGIPNSRCVFDAITMRTTLYEQTNTSSMPLCTGRN